MNSLIVKLLIVGTGSCLGGITRYLVSRAVQPVSHGVFPWGTFMVNIVGCFVIGLVYGFIDKGFQLSDNLKLFIAVGFCGGFTTFSTFIHENYLLFTGSTHLIMALYTLASTIAGFLMVCLAYYLTRM